MSNTKQLDLIIWGATGFTGQLVSEYINKKYSNTALKWGIAGRNKEKASVIAKRLNIAMDRVFIAQHHASQAWQYHAACSGYNSAMLPQLVHSLSVFSPQMSMTIWMW